MAEQNAAVGYAALKKQSSPTAVATPTVFTPYYKQNMMTDFHVMEDDPVYGNRFKHLQHLRGSRSHSGSLTVMAEPNTAGFWLDMLLSRSATSGAGPYTHTYGVSNTTDPSSYTLDISLGSQVVRFWGLQASSLKVAWEDEKMQFELETAALGSFYGREIASVTGSTVTLKTDYDAAPTVGLVNSDLVAIRKVDGSLTTNFTVTSFTSTVVTLNASTAAFAAGDMLVLRPATVSLSLQQPFEWGLTRYFFGADLATVVTASATASNQIRLEPGTELTLINEFESDEGSKRSGGFDPASLIRTVADYELKVKKYFDNPDDLKDWNALSKKAFVMRCYSGSTNQYELQVKFNNMTLLTAAPETESKSTIYNELEFGGNYDLTDGKAMEAVVINAVSTIT